MESEDRLGAEDSRGKESGVALQVLERMMGGEVFDVAAVMSDFKVSKGKANRCLNQLEDLLSAVKCDKSGKSYQFRFDSAELADVESQQEPIHLAGVIAVSLASAFSR